MSKRFNIPFNTLALLTLAIGMVHFASSLCFSADTYSVSQTAEVTLAWDPNDPAPDGYYIYQRTEGQSYDYSQPCWTGSGTTGTIYNLDWDTTYSYVVRAYAGGLESEDSEEVKYTSPSGNGSIYRQWYSISSDRSNPDELDGETVDGLIYAFVEPLTNIKRVEFFIDGVLHKTENYAPFDLSGGSSERANPLDTKELSQGPHTIGAQITKIDGTSETIIAEVKVSGADPIEVKYFISSSAGENGVIAPSSTVTIDEGANQTFTIKGDNGYHIANVQVDGESIGAVSTYTFSQVSANHTIHAAYKADTFAITATEGENGTISPSGSVNVTFGGSQTFTFTADSGFRVADVQVDGQSMGTIKSYTFTNVEEEHTLAVFFSEKSVVKIWIEAEDGDLQLPMEIADDENAAAGGYICVSAGTGNVYSPSDSAGYAEYHFEVPEAGDYLICGRQISNDNASDSFFVSIDDQPEIAWHTKLGGQDIWTWDVVSLRKPDDPRDTVSPELFHLPAGAHTLMIKQREDGTKLDRLLITNDPMLDIYEMMLSYSPDRSGVQLLSGSAVEGSIYVFVEPITNIKKVEFIIDGVLRQTENVAPYDLAGSAGSGLATPFDTRVLSQGPHTFDARISKSDGSIETISADVYVDGSIYKQWVSTSADRSNPDALSGATVQGKIYAFVEPVTDIKRVEFFIDGVLHRTENFAPYDLAGSAASELAAPFDADELSKGSHSFVARITKIDGSSETITANLQIAYPGN